MRNFHSLQFLRDSQEMLLISTGLYSWQMDNEFHLQYTNHTNGQLFYDMFKVSTCDKKIRNHFETQCTPVIISDDLGITWMVAAYKEEASVAEYHLLGPFFTVEASEHYLLRLCSRMHNSSILAEQMRTQLKQIPTVSASSALSYAVMLQYYTIGEKISREEVDYYLTTEISDNSELWQTSERHNTWGAEQDLFDAIKNGTLDLESMALTNSFSGGTIGTLCPGDPLRQSKDEAIVLIVLASRAAILGGRFSRGRLCAGRLLFSAGGSLRNHWSCPELLFGNPPFGKTAGAAMQATAALFGFGQRQYGLYRNPSV